MTEKLLELERLDIGYRGQRRGEAPRLVAEGLRASAGSGELVCLLGPNGSGKSTLLKTLAGMLPPLGGRGLIGGRDLGALPLSERAELVSIVLTEQPNAGWFSVFEIAAFGRYPYTDARGRLSSADRERVHACIKAVGLGDFEKRRFAELSDGERRKALVARALAQDTPLILLDEPTVYLDAPSRIELFGLVRDICRREKRAVILSTHELDLALDSADRIWLMTPAQEEQGGTARSLNNEAQEGSAGRAREGGAAAGSGASPLPQSIFIEGLPEELALNGTLDAALSTASTRYDACTGGFVPRERREPPRISISCEKPAAASRAGAAAMPPAPDAAAGAALLLKWAAHLVRRSGFLPAAPGQPGHASGRSSSAPAESSHRDQSASGRPAFSLSLSGSPSMPDWRLSTWRDSGTGTEGRSRRPASEMRGTGFAGLAAALRALPRSGEDSGSEQQGHN